MNKSVVADQQLEKLLENASRQIDNVYLLDKINRFNHQTFCLTQIQTKILVCPSLQKNNKFCELLNHLNKYNERLNDKTCLPADYQNVHFYRSLFRMLTVVIMTQNHPNQLKYLDTIFYWFNNKIQSKQEKYRARLISMQERKAKSQARSNSESSVPVEQPSKSKFRQDFSRNASNLPSEFIMFQTKLYNQKRRTAHNQTLVPSEKLQGYKRRLFEMAKFQPVTGTQQVQTRRLRAVYPKPQFKKTVQQQQQHKQTQIQNAGQEQQVIPENEAQLEPSEPQDKPGRLDPFVKPYLRPYDFNPDLNQNQLISAKKHQLDRIASKLQDKMFQQEMKERMNKWASARARVQSQISRKIVSINAKQPIADISAPLIKSPQQKIIEAIPHKQNQEFSFKKIDKKLHDTVNKYGKLIDIKDNQGRDCQQSISFFSRGRVKTESNRKNLTQILEQNNRTQVRANSLEQAQQLKSRLAKNNVSVRLGTLVQGVSIIQERQYNTALLPDVNLPNNPFFKIAKKKKKKKK